MKRKISHIIVLICIVFLMNTSVFAMTDIVGVDDNGVVGNNSSQPIAITSDGRYVLFYSYADNLVANDTNGANDVFVRDRVNNTTTRVSVDDMGVEANSDSYPVAIASGGRYVLFQSYADNLVANDTNGEQDIFVRDIFSGTTIRVNVDDMGIEANGYSEATNITPDGRYVMFYSSANNLVANDTNGAQDIFIRDVMNGTTIRVNVDDMGVEANSDAYGRAITPDGRYVLFYSYADNLVANDTNSQWDIFIRDVMNGTTIRVNVDDMGVEANGYSEALAVTPDGRYVLFQSSANNLVANDTNGSQDIFIRDMVNGTTIRANVDDMGVEANSDSFGAGISSDGRYVLFQSYADNLVVNDTNWNLDSFVRDMVNGTTIRVTVDSMGVEANNYSESLVISSDGRYILFRSYADNLVANDTNFVPDVFVKDIVNGTTTRVSVDDIGNEGNSDSYGSTITPDGRYVMFYSNADNLVANDTNFTTDVFVNERQVILGAAPTITTPADGDYRNQIGDIGVEGVGLSGADIRVTFLGNQFNTTVDINNQWFLQLPGQLDASYTIYAQQKPYGEGVRSATGSIDFIIDTTSPVAPTIISPIDNTLISGGITWVSGVGEAGGNVTVAVGNTVKTSSIDGFGNWNAGPFTIISGYKYGIVAKQQDIAGNQSNWSEARTVYGVVAGTVSINDSDYQPDLVLTKRGISGSGNISVTNPNEDIRYILDYLNVGNSYATGVTIYETIPANTCYTVGSISGLNDNYVVEYSNDKGVSYGYIPVGNSGSQDCSISDFRVRYIIPYEAKLHAISDEFSGIKYSLVGATQLSIATALYTPKSIGPSGFHKFGHGVSADFNNDGKIDVIGMGFAGNTTIFTNTSVGNDITFSTVEISPGGGSYFVGGDVGDFNSDGLIDAVGFGYNGFNTLFINTTSGGVISFSSSAFGTHENNTYHHGGDIADFNSDGKLDIIAMGHWGYTKIYTNISTGSNVVFQQTITSIGGTNGYFVGGAIGDFNADGRPDAVAGGYNGPTVVFTNISTGSNIVFSTQQYAGYDFGGNPEVGDFNSDGKLDFIRGSLTNNLFINTTVGTGTPTFTTHTIAGGLGQPVVHDYDNDGKLDIFNIGGYNGLRIFNNISTGLNVVFDSPFTIPQTTNAPHGVVGSDFNNDGKIDIFGFAWESFSDYSSVVYQSNNIQSGLYTSILYSSGNISGWDKIIVQEEVISGVNKIEYEVYGVTGGNMCDDSVLVVSRAESIGGEIDLGGYTGSNICMKAEFNILTGSVSPVLKSIIGIWNNEDIESFTFDVRVKGGNFSGTSVTNIAYISSNTPELITGNNKDIYEFTGLPNPTPSGGFGGGVGTPSNTPIAGGGNGGSPGTTTTNGDGTTTVVIKNGLTPQEIAGIIKNIDPTKPETPTVIIKPDIPVGPVTTIEIKPTSTNTVIKDAIVQTSFVQVGSVVDIKATTNPALGTEKKCYTPQEIVSITLGSNTTHKDQLVYQALLKSYDLTIFTDTDEYKPENSLTRHQAAKMFTNFAKHVLCREKVQEYVDGYYTDIDNTDLTLKPYIIQAYEYGILKGAGGKFRPSDTITKKEFIAALMRMFINENLDIYGQGNDWDRAYIELFEKFELHTIVDNQESEIDRYSMSKIIYKLYYNTGYQWTENGYVLPYSRD